MKRRFNIWFTGFLYSVLRRREKRAMKATNKAAMRLSRVSDELEAATKSCLEYYQKIAVYASVTPGGNGTGPKGV